MDVVLINTIGAQNFNQIKNPFSATTAPGANSPESFLEVFKRAQDSGTKTENGTTVLKNPPIDKSSQLYELCMELETILIKNLIKGMRSTIQKTNLIDTGFAGEMYEDMLYDEYAKTFAKNANLGFAEMAYRDLSRL